MIGLTLILIVVIFGVFIFKGWSKREHKRRFKTYDKIKESIEEGHYDSVDQFGRTLLMQAIKNDFTALTQKLLEKSNQLNRSDEKGETALFYAVRYENIKCLTSLLDKDMNISHKNIDGVTALWYAAKKSDTKYAETLINAGISLDDQEKNSLLSPIMVAIKNRNIATMKVIFEGGADLTLESKEGNVKTLLESYVIPHFKGYGREVYRNQEMIRRIIAKAENRVFEEMSYEKFKEKLNQE